MKKIIPHALVVIVLFSTLQIGCKHDAPDIPCLNQQEVKAGFIIEEGLEQSSGPMLWYPIDSVIYWYGQIRFTVTTPNIDSCRWFLGSEQLTQKQFYRIDFPSSTTIKATLIVYKHYKEGCTKNFKTSDTLTQVFNTYNYSTGFKDWTMFGVYEGYKKSDPQNKIQIEIGYVPHTVHTSSEGSYITNIPYNNFISRTYQTNNWSAISSVSPGTNTVFSFNIPTIIDGLGVKSKKNLFIHYMYYKDTLSNGLADYNSSKLYDEFKGIKIK